MQSVIPPVREVLVGYAPLMALVKAGTNPPRVYLMRAEQFTGGADVVINEVFGDMANDLAGATSPWTSRISLECRAATYESAVNVANACKAVLLPFKGIAKGQEIQGVMHASEYGDYNDEGTVFRQIVDFRITHAPA
jgi:hypothetical protein